MARAQKVVAWTITACALGLWIVSATPSDDLARLEARAREIPVTQSGYQVPDGVARYHDAIRLRRTVEDVLGATVTYVAPPVEGAAGLTIPATRQIMIDTKLRWDARFQVLAHETAHLLQPAAIADLSDGEVFAEGVLYLVSLRLGYDDLDVSARYLAAHKHGLHVLRDWRLEIQYAATVLTGIGQ